ncbi:MAG: stsC [Parachlamydiales bacterium]|nr:stsC [Parachlamydiales bacterium]
MQTALIGLGHHGQKTYLPVLQKSPGIKLVGVCDRDSTKLEDVIGGLNKYTSYRELFEKERLDFIVVATSHDAYPEIVVCAAEKGIHILKEKPFARTVEEGKFLQKIAEKNEVICPAYTFYATATPLFFTGAVPVLVDSDESGNINPLLIEKKITSNTKAILITHMWGNPCAMNQITDFAKKHQLLLIEDGSHAHGAEYHKKKAGTFGDLAIFSLQGQKTLTGGEGGFVLTPSDEFYYRAILMGHYNKRCLQEIPRNHPLYDFGVTGMGLKLRIHPLSAAIANEQLNHLDDVLFKRREMAKKMISSLGQLPGIRPPQISPHANPSWYAMVFQFDNTKLEGLSLKRFHDALIAEGCKELDLPTSTRPLNLLPLFQKPEVIFPKYQGKIQYAPGDFPIAESFYQNAFKLPVWHEQMDVETVYQYVNAFEKVINHYKELL